MLLFIFIVHSNSPMENLMESKLLFSIIFSSFYKKYIINFFFKVYNTFSNLDNITNIYLIKYEKK